MKKLIIALVIVIMAAGVAQASNIERIKELKKLKQRAQENIKIYEEAKQKETVLIIGVNAVLNELLDQDKKAVEEANRAEADKKALEAKRIAEAEAEAKIPESIE